MQTLGKQDCAICLARCTRPALLDECFHVFCFACALEWCRISAPSPSCPLCKAPVSALLCDVTADWSFTRYNVATGAVRRSGCGGTLSASQHRRRLVYTRSLHAVPPHPYRRGVPLAGGGQANGSAGLGGAGAPRARRVPLPHLSAATVRAQRDRLVPWMERELRIALQTDSVGLFNQVVVSTLLEHGTCGLPGAAGSARPARRSRWSAAPRSGARHLVVRVPQLRDRGRSGDGRGRSQSTTTATHTPVALTVLTDALGRTHGERFLHELRCFALSSLEPSYYDAITPYVSDATPDGSSMTLTEFEERSSASVVDAPATPPEAASGGGGGGDGSASGSRATADAARGKRGREPAKSCSSGAALLQCADVDCGKPKRRRRRGQEAGRAARVEHDNSGAGQGTGASARACHELRQLQLKRELESMRSTLAQLEDV